MGMLLLLDFQYQKHAPDRGWFHRKSPHDMMAGLDNRLVIFISYRCFVIKNGSLTLMRFMGDKRTHLSVLILIHGYTYED